MSVLYIQCSSTELVVWLYGGLSVDVSCSSGRHCIRPPSPLSCIKWLSAQKCSLPLKYMYFSVMLTLHYQEKATLVKHLCVKKLFHWKKAAWFYLLMRFVQLMVLRHKSICIVCSQRAADSVECLRVTMWSSWVSVWRADSFYHGHFDVYEWAHFWILPFEATTRPYSHQ